MPYLHCPDCHRTAWVRAGSAQQIACRHCGAAVNPMSVNEDRRLVGAVRERFARDARLNAGRRRFIRDPRQTSD
jgi:ribosomal protein L37AE/L43A